MGWAILLVIFGAPLALLMVYALRPAGPVQRGRRHQDRQEPLLAATTAPPAPGLTPDDLAELARRLRSVEKFLAPSLSETQVQWFDRNLRDGRIAAATEHLARWTAAARVELPANLADDLGWVADSLAIGERVDSALAPALQREHVRTGRPGQAGVHVGCFVPPARFDQLVSNAIDSIPAKFRQAMGNVAIMVEDEHPGQPLYGLYEGVPLTKRRFFTWGATPDRITIFRKTICEHCTTEAEVVRQVRTTVIHEVGHHFGISDQRLQELGWG